MMKQENQWIQLDNIRRKSFLRWEAQRQFLRGLLENSSCLNVTRSFWNFRYTKIPFCFSSNRQVLRCVYSGRPTAISRKIRLSRFQLRKISSAGDFPGIRRASW